MTIYLIRHGQTDWNRENRLQGREDIALNETGLRQAEECAAALRAVPAGVILSSPLKRALVTAEIISRAAGSKPAGTPVIVEQDLIERDFGPLSGVALKDREATLGYSSDPRMEPFEELADRLMRVLRRYIEAAEFEDILVVSHGGTINAILSVLSGGEIGTGKTILKNVCISKLRASGASIEIEFFNLTPKEFTERFAK